MSLLEDLKKQADEKKNSAIEDSPVSRQRLDGNALVLAPKFNYVKSYLKELAENLNVINPDERFSFAITRRVMLKNFVKRNFRLEQVKDNGKSACALRYELVQERELKPLVDSVAEADLAMKVMKERNIRFTHKPASNNKVQLIVKPQITTSFIFSVDLQKGVIVLRIKNFDGTWDQMILYAPNKVTEKLLDEMGKYILNKPNNFMAMSGNTLSDSMRGRLKSKLTTDNRASRNTTANTKDNGNSKGLFGMFRKK